MTSLFRCCSVFFFKQKTSYELRISDWSSDVCSSDLRHRPAGRGRAPARRRWNAASTPQAPAHCPPRQSPASRARARAAGGSRSARWGGHRPGQYEVSTSNSPPDALDNPAIEAQSPPWRRPAVIWLLLYPFRSEEHTSELQSLMRTSYAVFCLKKKT